MATDSNGTTRPVRRQTAHYSNVSLFDDKAKVMLEGLSVAQLLSTDQDSNESNIQAHMLDADVDLKQHLVSGVMMCNCCHIQFGDRAEQISHYRCDWHRYNLHRQLKGLDCVKEEDFELLAGDVSSISGSDTDSDHDVYSLDLKSMKLPDTVVSEDENQTSKNDSRVTRLDKIFFKNSEGELLSLYKCLFSHKKSPVRSSSDILWLAHQLGSHSQWAVIMLSSGHFAAAIFNGNTVIQHKTFHRYTVRAKRGSAQSTRDNQGNAPKSAGATLRRYNEAALDQEVRDLLSSWQNDLNSCTMIFVRIPVGYRGIFYAGKNPALMKDDLRIRIIPFPTRRPTLSEVKRVHQMLSNIECYGQAADVVDFIPLSPQRVYSKDKNQLEIRSTISSPAKDKPHKQEKHEMKNNKDCEKELEISDDEFDINPIGPGNPLEEFDVCVENKKKKRKPKPGKTDTVNSKTIANRLEDPVLTELKNNLFTACKTGNVCDAEKFIINLNTHFKEDIQPNDLICDNDGINICNECDGKSVSADDVPSTLLTDTNTTVGYEDKRYVSSNGNGKVIEVLNSPIGESKSTLLHYVCQENCHTIIPLLLENGADPAIKDKDNRVPYFMGSAECKKTFRRFMALFPQKYDYQLAQIPSPLTAEMEASKKQKNAERRAVKKKSMQERNKVKKEVQAKLREEEELKERYLKLSDREKRALAAEKRMLQQLDDKSVPRPVLSRCFQCGNDITGKVPFEYSDFKFCTTKCLKDHRLQSKS